MSTTLKQKNVWDYIADLNQRVNRLETGGKPIVESNSGGVTPFTLPAGATATVTTTISWADANITAKMMANYYQSFYIGTDNSSAHYWPEGGSIDSSKHHISWFYDFVNTNNEDFKETVIKTRVENKDSGSHDYYLRNGYVFIGGQSGSGV